MIVMRYGQLSDAGILSLAFAVGNVLLMIGKFGGRTFQVTDVKRQFVFGEYLIQRICTVVLMMLSLCALLCIVHYPDVKRKVIITISIIYAVEALEDCLWGLLQSHNRLYVGGAMFSTRWMMILCAFCLVLIYTGDMAGALVMGALTGGGVFLLWLVIIRRDIINALHTGNEHIQKGGKERFPDLFRQTWPLFLSGFCAIFINSIPKFAIDRYMSNEVQAGYGFVSMPVFVIGLLNQFVYQPTIVKLTDDYYNNKKTEFCRGVNRQMCIVVFIAVGCVAGAALIGIPVLSAIYHTDLNVYRAELIVLQFAGGFLALTGYFTVLLTLMRQQKTVLTGYVVSVLISLVVLNVSVKKAGTMGASVGYVIIMCAMFAFYYCRYRKYVSQFVSEGRSL